MVEAKADYKAAADGVQQAKIYAEMLGVKFAFATNGHEIIEIDYSTGLERSVTASIGVSDPAQADRLLTPFNHAVGKGERYYQQIAINRSVEGARKGDQRMLFTMATGTGKTAVAFQMLEAVERALEPHRRISTIFAGGCSTSAAVRAARRWRSYSMPATA